MTDHTHTFYVFSTAINEAAIMVLCRCGQFGVIAFDDHTQEEWRAAFSAPTNPYVWPDNNRVTLKWMIDPDDACALLPREITD
jgi:hypothetical protein